MKAVWLASWAKGETEKRLAALEKLGHRTAFEPLDAGRLFRSLKEDPPRAVVIDLSRSPAQGRDLGVALRVHGATRHIPLVFAGGLPEKVAAVRRLLPDAAFTSWEEVAPALERALDSPPENPVVPDSMLAGYSGTPLPKKLGIKKGSRVWLAHAPVGFADTLGALPEGAELVEQSEGEAALILWFVRSRRQLDDGIGRWAAKVSSQGIWILWPKKSSGIASDLSQALVRKCGLSNGLVDYKIAAIDEIWSGLKFAVRRRDPDTD